MEEFYKMKKEYELYILGNDFDAKYAQKLKPMDDLKLVRLEDELDTYELVVTTANDKELDMLAYEESIGIAPFLDDGNLKISACKVVSVTLEKGASRAKDSTTVKLSVEYAYVPENLKPVEIDGVLGFIPAYDFLLAMAIYACLNGKPIMEKVYLNCYQFECPIYDDTFLEDEDIDTQSLTFSCSVLFNPEFSKCKVSVKLYNDKDEYQLAIPLEIKERALLLVNHTRIFEDLDPVDCIIEE